MSRNEFEPWRRADRLDLAVTRRRRHEHQPRSKTGPAPQSIPFASRVRCLVALSACRRRTALGPELLAAGPASNSTLLSIGSPRANFAARSARSETKRTTRRSSARSARPFASVAPGAEPELFLDALDHALGDALRGALLQAAAQRVGEALRVVTRGDVEPAHRLGEPQVGVDARDHD